MNFESSTSIDRMHHLETPSVVLVLFIQQLLSMTVTINICHIINFCHVFKLNLLNSIKCSRSKHVTFFLWAKGKFSETPSMGKTLLSPYVIMYSICSFLFQRDLLFCFRPIELLYVSPLQKEIEKSNTIINWENLPEFEA